MHHLAALTVSCKRAPVCAKRPDRATGPPATKTVVTTTSRPSMACMYSGMGSPGGRGGREGTRSASARENHPLSLPTAASNEPAATATVFLLQPVGRQAGRPGYALTLQPAQARPAALDDRQHHLQHGVQRPCPSALRLACCAPPLLCRVPVAALTGPGERLLHATALQCERRMAEVPLLWGPVCTCAHMGGHEPRDAVLVVGHALVACGAQGSQRAHFCEPSASRCIAAMQQSARCLCSRSAMISRCV